MSESHPVPGFILGWKHLPAPLDTEWRCHCCAFRAIAVSERAVADAMDAHAIYVNTQLDRATDPHFDEIRLDRLIHG